MISPIESVEPRPKGSIPRKVNQRPDGIVEFTYGSGDPRPGVTIRCKAAMLVIDGKKYSVGLTNHSAIDESASGEYVIPLTDDCWLNSSVVVFDAID